MRVWIISAIVIAAVFFWGAKNTYTGLTEGKQLEITCADYVKHRPDNRWLKLTSCEYDFDHLAYIYEGSAKTIRSVYIPLRPAGEESGPTHIIVKRDDKETIQVVSALEDNRDAPQPQMDHVTAELQKPAEGMVLRGIDLDDRDKGEIDKLDLGLAKDFVIVDQGGKPKLLLGILMLLGGLAGGALFVFMLVRKRRQSKAAPPPPQWGTPGFRGPNAPAAPNNPLGNFEKPI